MSLLPRGHVDSPAAVWWQKTASAGGEDSLRSSSSRRPTRCHGLIDGNLHESTSFSPFGGQTLNTRGTHGAAGCHDPSEQGDKVERKVSTTRKPQRRRRRRRSSWLLFFSPLERKDGIRPEKKLRGRGLRSEPRQSLLVRVVIFLCLWFLLGLNVNFMLFSIVE